MNEENSPNELKKIFYDNYKSMATKILLGFTGQVTILIFIMIGLFIYVGHLSIF